MRFLGSGLSGAVALVLAAAASGPAAAQELSEKSIRSIMEYAWALTPQQFSMQSGKVIVVDKTKKDEVMVPLETAREIVRVARISAHAQVCNLPDEQVMNHRSLMKREEEKKKWTDQQILYINQLHLATIMLLTGKIKVVEKEGEKEVSVDDSKQASPQTCTDEQKSKVKELITAYVNAGPVITVPVAGAPAAAATASVPAAGAKAPAAALPAPAAAEKK